MGGSLEVSRLAKIHQYARISNVPNTEYCLFCNTNEGEPSKPVVMKLVDVIKYAGNQDLTYAWASTEFREEGATRWMIG